MPKNEKAGRPEGEPKTKTRKTLRLQAARQRRRENP
jgi:hypothetical protein